MFGVKIEPTGLAVGTHRFHYGWVIVGVVALASFTQSAETLPILGVLLSVLLVGDTLSPMLMAGTVLAAVGIGIGSRG